MLDHALEESLSEAVRQAGQPESVARRLTAWLRQMSQGAPLTEDYETFLQAARDELDLGNKNAD